MAVPELRRPSLDCFGTERIKDLSLFLDCGIHFSKYAVVEVSYPSTEHN